MPPPQEPAPDAGERTRPNVVVVVIDDLGAGDLGCNGNEVFRTPHIDRLAARSVRLERFHAAPTCSPTRAELLTGRWHPRAGVWGVFAGRDHLDPGAPTAAEVFRDAGWRTAMIGKWHLGDTWPHLPQDRGFEQVWRIAARLYQHRDPLVERVRAGEVEQVAVEGRTAEWVVDTAIEFARAHRDEPFFAWIAFPEVHTPWLAPDALVREGLRAGLSPPLALLGAMLRELDGALGRLVLALDELGLARDTILVVTGDNGPDDLDRATIRVEGEDDSVELGAGLSPEEWAARNALGLRAGKGTVFEGGTRVPCLVAWPARLRPRSVREPAAAVDLLPTLLELAGIARRAPAGLDGASLAPLLEGRDEPWPERPLFSLAGVRDRAVDGLGPVDKARLRFEDQTLAVQLGRWKLVREAGQSLLFDLDGDPGESADRAGEEPERAARLTALARSWWDALVADERAFRPPLFHLGAGRGARIPASAVTAVRGNVRPASNATTGWREAGDGQSFALEVHDARRYRLELRLIPRPGLGTLVARVGERSASAPLAETRRRLLDLGPLELEEGRAELRLELTDLPAGRTPGLVSLLEVRLVSE
jgi:uncharacterized sulfatase